MKARSSWRLRVRQTSVERETNGSFRTRALTIVDRRSPKSLPARLHGLRLETELDLPHEVRSNIAAVCASGQP